MNGLIALHVALPDGKKVIHENVKDFAWGTVDNKILTVQTLDGRTIKYGPGEWLSCWNGEFSVSYPPRGKAYFTSIKPEWV